MSVHRLHHIGGCAATNTVARRRRARVARRRMNELRARLAEGSGTSTVDTGASTPRGSQSLVSRN